MRRCILMLTLVAMLCGCSNHAKEQIAVVFEDAATFPTETVETIPLLNIDGEVAQRSYPFD